MYTLIALLILYQSNFAFNVQMFVPNLSQFSWFLEEAYVPELQAVQPRMLPARMYKRNCAWSGTHKYRPNNLNIRSKKPRTRESTKSKRDFRESPDLSRRLRLTDTQCAYTMGWSTRTKTTISYFSYLRVLPPTRIPPTVDASSRSPDR